MSYSDSQISEVIALNSCFTMFSSKINVRALILNNFHLFMFNEFQETETQMVWPHLKILWHGEDNFAWDGERSKKERKTEEEMGR